MSKRTMLEEVILGEISGKNSAIHAYDGIVWKIRSGYLTLVFGGWAILLKSLAGGTVSNDKACIVVISMFLVNLGMSFGGYFIDCNYVRRKFRVILALNELVKAVKDAGEDLHGVPPALLEVTGDDSKRNYECKGYREASKAGIAIYFVPALLLAVAVCIIIVLWK